MLRKTLSHSLPIGLLTKAAPTNLTRRSLCVNGMPPLPPHEPLSKHRPSIEGAVESKEIKSSQMIGSERRKISAIVAKKGGIIVLCVVGGIIGSFFAYTTIIVLFIASG